MYSTLETILNSAISSLPHLNQFAGRAVMMVIGTFFLVAAVGKYIAGLNWVSRHVFAFTKVNSKQGRCLAAGLIFVEFSTGFFLLLDYWPLLVLPFATVLLIGFSTVLMVIIWRDLMNTCGCFGRRSSRISWRIVYRNLGMSALLILVFHTKIVDEAFSVEKFLVLLWALSVSITLYTNVSHRSRRSNPHGRPILNSSQS